MQVDVKSNLYASLDIIPKSKRMGQNHGQNNAQNGLLHHQISPKRSKWSETVQNYRKWVKNFKKFL